MKTMADLIEAWESVLPGPRGIDSPEHQRLVRALKATGPVVYSGLALSANGIGGVEVRLPCEAVDMQRACAVPIPAAAEVLTMAEEVDGEWTIIVFDPGTGLVAQATHVDQQRAWNEITSILGLPPHLVRGEPAPEPKTESWRDRPPLL